MWAMDAGQNWSKVPGESPVPGQILGGSAFFGGRIWMTALGRGMWAYNP